jgi:hypothetical protein
MTTMMKKELNEVLLYYIMLVCIGYVPPSALALYFEVT